MTFKKRTGGAFVDITAPKRRSGGAWVTPTAVKVREGGIWVTVWPTGGVSPTVSIANHTMRSESLAEPNPTPPPITIRYPGYASFQLTAAGAAIGRALEDTGDSIGNEHAQAFTNWLTGGSASDVEVRATVASGTVDAGDSTGVWLSMSSDRFWRANTSNNASVDANQAVLTIELRNSTTLAVLDTATITLAEGPAWSIS